jgi:hypothetical protein
MICLRFTVALCLLAFGSEAAAQDDPPPSQSDQERILALMRQYVASYKVPDVAFEQAITFFGSSGPGTLSSQRIHHDGHTYFCCRTGKNGKQIPGEWREPFTPHYSTLFPWGRDHATTVWNRWETLQLHRLAVFDYQVKKEDSTALTCEKPVWSGGPFSGHVTCRYSEKIPYHGAVWVDPETGAIWRNTDTQDEFPARDKIRYNASIEEYDEIVIGTTPYMLVVRIETTTRTKIDAERNETVFRNYRKFEADSNITFFGADSSIKFGK